MSISFQLSICTFSLKFFQYYKSLHPNSISNTPLVVVVDPEDSFILEPEMRAYVILGDRVRFSCCSKHIQSICSHQELSKFCLMLAKSSWSIEAGTSSTWCSVRTATEETDHVDGHAGHKQTYLHVLGKLCFDRYMYGIVKYMCFLYIAYAIVLTKFMIW